jgi:hypothetical protein
MNKDFAFCISLLNIPLLNPSALVPPLFIGIIIFRC